MRFRFSGRRAEAKFFVALFAVTRGLWYVSLKMEYWNQTLEI